MGLVREHAVVIGAFMATLAVVVAVGGLGIQVIIHRTHLSRFFGEKVEISRGYRWVYGTMLVLAGMIWAGLLCAYCSRGGEGSPGADGDEAEVVKAEPVQPEPVEAEPVTRVTAADTT